MDFCGITLIMRSTLDLVGKSVMSSREEIFATTGCARDGPSCRDFFTGIPFMEAPISAAERFAPWAFGS